MAFADKLGREFCICYSSSSQQQFIELFTCNEIRGGLEQEEVRITGDGPRTGNEDADTIDRTPLALNPHFVGHAFELLDLLRQMRVEAQSDLSELYLEVARAALLFHRGPVPPPIPDFKNSGLFVNINVQQERDANMATYGSYDPLYWDVLLRGQESAFTLLEPATWRDCVIDLIETVRLHLRQREEYQRLQAKPPELNCCHCHATNARVECCPPFDAYCSPECQLEAWNKWEG